MPTHTLPISLRTLPIGQTTFGPLNVGNNTRAEIDIDRTVAGGLNSLTAASTLDILIQTSDDGVTWHNEVEAVFGGGIITNPVQGQINTNSITVQGADSGAIQVQIIATVSGPAPIAISGTATVS